MGGDEFAVLIRGVDLAEAKSLAEEIRALSKLEKRSGQGHSKSCFSQLLICGRLARRSTKSFCASRVFENYFRRRRLYRPQNDCV